LSSVAAKVHKEVLGRDKYVLKNLHLPESLPPRGALITVAPLLVAGAPEGPCRVFAWLPK